MQFTVASSKPRLQSSSSWSCMKIRRSSGPMRLLETTNEHLRSVTEIGQSTDNWDSLLVLWSAAETALEARKQWCVKRPGK